MPLPAGAGPEAALPRSVVQNIADPKYDKRKAAALEIEQLVKREAAAGRAARVQELVAALSAFALSSQVWRWLAG